MAKKRNWKHIHKVRVHHNRWLAWAIAIAVLSAAALVGYIKVSDEYFLQQVGADSSAITSTWLTFKNTQHKFSVKYPRNWAVEADNDSTISFVNIANPNEYVSVSTYPASQEREVRTSLFTTKEDKVTVNGVSAVMISQSKKQPESVIMMKSGVELYVLRGKGEMFNKVAATFKLD